MEFAVTVALKCKELHNISLDLYSPDWWADILIKRYYRGSTESSTATELANLIKKMNEEIDPNIYCPTYGRLGLCPDTACRVVGCLDAFRLID